MKRKHRTIIPGIGWITLIFFLVNCAPDLQQKINYPVTGKDVSVVDDYFGTRVSDPYRWLEDDRSEETGAWVAAQNEVTFNYLAQIPFREKIRKRLTELWNYPQYSIPFRKNGRLYFYKNNGLQNQSVLYVQEPQDKEATVLLDPNTYSEDGTVALKGVYLSQDGRYLGYSISSGGSDWQEFFIMDLDHRKKLDDHIQWTKFSGISWFRDGFYYNRFPNLNLATN